MPDEAYGRRGMQVTQGEGLGREKRGVSTDSFQPGLTRPLRFPHQREAHATAIAGVPRPAASCLHFSSGLPGSQLQPVE
ncbi:hypothetical protein MC885_018018 [Smutsia gigantea]|nr:hypothetical protein MC885_018018 [Smutsia gigantea]